MSKHRGGERVMTNAHYHRMTKFDRPMIGTLVKETGWGAGVWVVEWDGFGKDRVHESLLMEVKPMTVKVKDVTLKGGGFEWVAVGKDHWHGVVPEGKLSPRIRRLDPKWFSCYRDGKYLGHETSMQLAFDRIKSNHVSDKNVALALWAKEHPDELPPYLDLTAAERTEYWRHNPIANKAKPLVGEVLPRTGEVKVAGKVVGHSATVELPTREKFGRIDKPKPDRVVKKPVPKEGKNAELVALLTRKGGCTRDEILRVTGWVSVSVQAVAKKLGLVLTVDESSKPFKYHGKEG